MQTLPITSAPALAERLRELYAERALAQVEGLTDNGLYLADLDHEIATFRSAYTGAAVTEIATLRARLSGPLQG